MRSAILCLWIIFGFLVPFIGWSSAIDLTQKHETATGDCIRVAMLPHSPEAFDTPCEIPPQRIVWTIHDQEIDLSLGLRMVGQNEKEIRKKVGVNELEKRLKKGEARTVIRDALLMGTLQALDSPAVAIVEEIADEKATENFSPGFPPDELVSRTVKWRTVVVISVFAFLILILMTLFLRTQLVWVDGRGVHVFSKRKSVLLFFQMLNLHYFRSAAERRLKTGHVFEGEWHE